MNRTIALAVGVIFILGMAGLLIVVVPMLGPEPVGMSVTLYDADGEKVYTVGAPTRALFDFAFVNDEGAIVVSAATHISYEVTITGETADVIVNGELVVESFLADMPGLPPIISKKFTLSDMTTLIGSYDETIDLIDFIYATAYPIGTSYKYVFTATLTATNSDGVTSEPWTDSCILFIDWVPDGLSIVGSIYTD